MWLEPISDRTTEDVSYAKKLNASVREAGTFDVLTDEEKALWLAGLKGCLNAVDLNRIEGNTEHIKELLRTYGYSTISLGFKTDWTVEDFTFAEELERIRQNVQNLVDGYYTQTTRVPESLSNATYADINDIEKVLFLLDEMIGIMVSNFNRICGTFATGQSTILP